MAPLWISILTILAPSARAQAIQDSRCYLMNGGAVESFFISENTPVGSVVGTLSVNGDPSATGDISLSLQERDAALSIAAGTKELTLVRPLDREERDGPSSLYVNVRCERRRTSDPSFIIPVSVRVWDVNDNAPAWRGAPFAARVSELAAPGARVLAAPALDADQPGPHATVHYSVLPGPHSEYVGFANELDSMVVVKKALDFEAVRSFTVRLRAQDQGTPPRHNDTTLTVQVLDADDQNPKFTHDHYFTILPDDAQEGTELETQPGPIAAADQDEGICAPLQFALAASAPPLLRVQRDSGRVAATALLLQADLPLTLLIKATQVDNPDRYAVAALEVRGRGGGGGGAGGGGGLRFSRRSFAARVREDLAPGAPLLRLDTSPRALPQAALQFYVSDKRFLEKFAISAAGEVVLRAPLDFETQDAYLYQVMVSDGLHNDTATLNISVADVNEWEPRFRSSAYHFRLTPDRAAAGGAGGGRLAVGRLQAHDGDRDDAVALRLHGPHARLFFIDSEGELFLKQEALSTLNSSLLQLTVTAVDSGEPPDNSVPVVVRVEGVEGAEGAQGAGAGRGAAVAGFAGAMALLALLALALLVYAWRRRRGKRGEGSAGAGAGAGDKAAGGGSLLSVSAGASTILAGSTNSLERTDALHGGCAKKQPQRLPLKSKVAPAPPRAGAGTGGALLSDHVGAGAAGRSGVAWPSATIPARVKKLSWDDAQGERGSGGSGGSVAEATNAAVGDHMNLTVYF